MHQGLELVTYKLRVKAQGLVCGSFGRLVMSKQSGRSGKRAESSLTGQVCFIFGLKPVMEQARR